MCKMCPTKNGCKIIERVCGAISKAAIYEIDWREVVKLKVRIVDTNPHCDVRVGLFNMCFISS